MREFNIIPKPVHVKQGDGVFTFAPETIIFTVREYESAAEQLAEALARATGNRFDVKQSDQEKGPLDSIFLWHDARRSDLGDEGYAISVNEHSIIVRAFRPAGAFYACQTLCQMLPVPNAAGEDAVAALTVPQAEIEDRPRFPWRGFMLDSVRHFQDKAFIKRFIDTLAFYKINRLHWHLCDSQGWRIEINEYPELTRTTSGLECPFYSKSDIREIIDYARARHVRVYPEVEMPGHSEWPLEVFKDLRCENAKPNPEAFCFGEYCLGSEKTELFLKTVLSEVMELFPEAIIHLGGDEANSNHWRDCPKCQACIRENGLENEIMLQKWFMHKMADHVRDKGRDSIAWAEHQELGWPEGQIVQGWHAGESDYAITHGMQTVNSNHEYVYFDYPNGPDDPMQEKWMLKLPLQKVYAFDPVPAGATPEQAALVLGSEVCIWTEKIPQDKVNEKTFPRLMAFSESVWSLREVRDWEDFKKRVAIHNHLLDAMGVSYYRGSYDTEGA